MSKGGWGVLDLGVGPRFGQMVAILDQSALGDGSESGRVGFGHGVLQFDVVFLFLEGVFGVHFEAVEIVESPLGI